MTDQLNLLGDTAQPEDEQLGPVQRACMRVIRRLGSMSWDEAGAIAHAERGKHTVDERCEFCGTDGATLLESLIRRQLVEPNGFGHVRLPRPLQNPSPVQGDDAPQHGQRDGLAALPTLAKGQPCA